MDECDSSALLFSHPKGSDWKTLLRLASASANSSKGSMNGGVYIIINIIIIIGCICNILRHLFVKAGSKKWDDVIKTNIECALIKQEFMEHPIAYCLQLLLNYGSEPKISQRLCYWFCTLKRVDFHTKFNQFLFLLDPLLVWHETGVILLISAGGSKFQTTMSEQASAPGENSKVHVFVFVRLHMFL